MIGMIDDGRTIARADATTITAAVTAAGYYFRGIDGAPVYEIIIA